MQDAKNPTPLQVAVQANKVDQVKKLVETGATVNEKNELGETALHLAPTAEIVTILLDAGADLEMTTDHLDTPLHYAAARGFLPVVEALLKNGANPNARHVAKDYPPLFCPIISTEQSFLEENQKKIIEALLNAGANINASATLTGNLLQTAMLLDFDRETVEWILNLGADPSSRNGYGMTGIEIAKTRRPELLPLLQKHELDPIKFRLTQGWHPIEVREQILEKEGKSSSPQTTPSLYEEPYVNSRMIEDLTSWQCDGGDQVTSVNLLDGQNAYRYHRISGENGHMYLTVSGEESYATLFGYKAFGQLENGLHVVAVAEVNSEQHKRSAILLLKIEEEECLTLDPKTNSLLPHKRVNLIKKGQVDFSSSEELQDVTVEKDRFTLHTEKTSTTYTTSNENGSLQK